MGTTDKIFVRVCGAQQPTGFLEPSSKGQGWYDAYLAGPGDTSMRILAEVTERQGRMAIAYRPVVSRDDIRRRLEAKLAAEPDRQVAARLRAQLTVLEDAPEQLNELWRDYVSAMAAYASAE